MTSPLGDNVWVFHAGALGDHVMIWPLVRALARQGASVTVVCAGSHARLCEQEIARQVGAGAGVVRGSDSEHPRFNALWRGPQAVTTEWVEPGVSMVVTFLADLEHGRGRVWHASAARMFPNAERVFVGRPDRKDGEAQRREVWTRARVAQFGGVEARRNVEGPIVLYPGAGSDDKRVSDEQWGRVARLLLVEKALGTPPIHVVLGRNEVERGVSAEGILRVVNHHSRVRVVTCAELPALAEELRGARVVAGADTGPLHLSAQLGVPTVAVFGPTNAWVWSPVGPRVRVVQAEMTWALGLVKPEAIVQGIVALAGD